MSRCDASLVARARRRGGAIAVASVRAFAVAASLGAGPGGLAGSARATPAAPASPGSLGSPGSPGSGDRSAKADAEPAPTPGRGVEALGADDLDAVARAVAELVALPPSDADADALFAAARACEGKLLDPGRALAIYARIVADHPSARVASAAERRLAVLRAQLGPHGEHAANGRALAQLIARAETLPLDEVLRAGDRLADAAWPGAPDAALWLADWQRRAGRLGEAQARYAQVSARWRGSPQAHAAVRAGMSCALEARDWALAAHLAAQLPDDDRVARDEGLAAAARGQARARWYRVAWAALAAGLATLAGSLAVTLRRRPRGARWSALRPPFEVMFLAPVAAVLVAIAATAHALIAPAVAIICGGGLAVTWLSGAALAAAHGAPRGRRIALHVAASLIAVAGASYVAAMHGGLLDELLATVRFGLDP